MVRIIKKMDAQLEVIQKTHKSDAVTKRGASKNEDDSLVQCDSDKESNNYDPTTHPEWRLRIETAESLAYEHGQQRGYEDGVRNLESTRQRLTNLMERIPRELDKHSEKIEEMAVHIALASVVRIVGEHALDRPRAIQTIRNLVSEIKAETINCVHLSPADYEFLEQQKIELAAARKILQIVPSKHVALGGCIIDTANGSLDARFETQLRRVYEILNNTLGQGNHE